MWKKTVNWNVRKLEIKNWDRMNEWMKKENLCKVKIEYHGDIEWKGERERQTGKKKEIEIKRERERERKKDRERERERWRERGWIISPMQNTLE